MSVEFESVAYTLPDFMTPDDFSISLNRLIHSNGLSYAQDQSHNGAFGAIPLFKSTQTGPIGKTITSVVSQDPSTLDLIGRAMAAAHRPMPSAKSLLLDYRVSRIKGDVVTLDYDLRFGTQPAFARQHQHLPEDGVKVAVDAFVPHVTNWPQTVVVTYLRAVTSPSD